MNDIKVRIQGTEYELSTKLRVAYKVQGQNAHKPYSEIFAQLDGMPLEKQVEILYAAFEVANPEVAKQITFQRFLDEYLDNYNLKDVLAQLKGIIGGILGEDLNDKTPEGKESEGN